MFEEIHNYIKTNFELSKVAENAMISFYNSMNKSNEKIKNAMLRIGEKYNFEIIRSLKTTPHISTNTIFFWRELFQFPMSIAMDEEEIDIDFMLFINENDISSPLLRDIDGELEKACFDIYHTWVAYNFQITKLYESGLPMGITVNSDIVSYYFNDFSYDNFSNYHHIYEKNKRLSRPFERNLSIEEIFIRTHLIRFPYKRIKLFSEFSEKSETMVLENSYMIKTLVNTKTEEIISTSEKKLIAGNRYDRKEGTDINELINYFESTINKNFRFNLEKCEIE